MKSLYFECNSGISGDMTVAALLDLGADEKVLREGLASLNVSGYALKISRVKKSGIMACDFNVILDEDHDDHDHNGHHHDHDGHHHDHDGHHHDHDGHHHDHDGHHHDHDGHHHDHDGHHHDHDDHHHDHDDHHHDHDDHHHDHDDHHHDHDDHHHDHDGHHHDHDDHHHDHDGHHHHEHRNLSDVLDIIGKSSISHRAKDIACAIFRVVAQAEATVHGLPVDQVHFHEVGAVDSIVDIVGTAICVDNLGVDRIFCSPLSEGIGTVWCQHGRMPVPAPATFEIMRRWSIPMVITKNVGEMVTPTGAAIVAALAQGFCAPTRGILKRIGYGAGKKEFEHSANLLRVSLWEPNSLYLSDEVLELTCNIDDMTGEQLGFACELLLEKGALDVWVSPIQMKKNRPAHMLSLLIEPSQEEEMAKLLFLHTSTIGVRMTTHKRRKMERRSDAVETPLGPVAVKRLSYGDVFKTAVEYESARKLAKEKALPLNQIYNAAYHAITGEN
ncbi:nickel pincer cofactor biosynthesis protein LarC [Oscillospiraceae bacterium MB08-C2-2]|nr:nickel pincer cofactor biosynthesis protein LarC [Oscillospiraceae bacterium MB08-C2-2]